MRHIILIGLAVAGVSLTACSKEHQKEVSEGASAAATKIGDAAKDIASDPEVKQAGSAIADAAKDDATAVKDAVGDAADKTSEAADKAAADAKAKADADKARDAAKK
ncbi:CHASE3 domain sensor protein [Caulobacter ginsengisoli]|uniref:CHASE3 domain sensor protein n=1 Tax=Caulobacter ginsengisoli TaxID=400775 RepID=A0ABU0IYI3_9CAUL|nr:cell surface protein [Caulobacter ginsengisoli]MDQ0466410.1 CHASE3 domain sensor protein [Caulobacter ginsengisoli]